jgi:hypothetical protein
MERRVDALVEPLSLLMSELADIAARIENVQKSHSGRIEAASVQLREQLDCEFQEAARVIRTEFEERVRVAGEEWTRERQALLSEIARLRQADRRELSEEIAQSEAALNQVRITIQAMVDDPSVAISKVVRAKARESELAAYLKGLNFKAGIANGREAVPHEVAIAAD